MNDARLDRNSSGDATGNASQVNEPRDARPALPRRVRPSMGSTILHWIDEKGSVVRLLASTTHDEESPIRDA